MEIQRPSPEFVAFSLALVLMVAIGGASYNQVQSSARDVAWMDETQEFLLLLEETRLAMREGLAYQRTYLLTGDNRFLVAFAGEISVIPRHIEKLRDLKSKDPEQLKRITVLEGLCLERNRTLETAVQQKSPREGALQGLEPDREFENLRLISKTFETIKNEELRLLAVRTLSTEESRQRTRTAIIGGNLLAFAILLFAFGTLRRDNLARRRAEEALSRANAELSEHAREAEARRAEIQTLAEMTAGLHSCLDIEEMEPVMRQVQTRLWPETSGAIYLFRSSPDLLQRVAAWPADYEAGTSLAPVNCWALRTGQVNHYQEGAGGQKCPHLQGTRESLCVPLVAGETTAGVLSSEVEGAQAPVEWKRVVLAAAGPVGLAAANLQLREKLKSESIRDPLTGLFNRRYFAEVFEKECARATRSGRPIGLIFADLDHFKSVNDMQGHAAGDAVLREFGALLRDAVRGGDIACRWGGEEFVLLLPESPAEGTVRRAEALRKSFEGFRMVHKGRILEPMTASFGVASFPENGTAPEELLRRADEALYRAKMLGRNRVAVAEI